MASKDYNRQSNGKFGAGNDGGPGRPRREIEAEYLSATVASITVEDWQKVISSMLHFAKAGNVQAATWLGNYILGKPTERIAIETDGNSTDVLSWGVDRSNNIGESESEHPALPEPKDTSSENYHETSANDNSDNGVFPVSD